MLTDISLVDVVFRVSIFLLLAYKLYDLIRAYLIPALFEQIAAERKQQTEIMEKDKLLLSTRHRLENQIYNQKHVFTLLEKNVQVWNRLQQEHADELERENRSIIEKLHERRAIQRKNLSLSHTLNLSIPQALTQAAKTLEERYSSNDGKNFLHNTITSLESSRKRRA